MPRLKITAETLKGLRHSGKLTKEGKPADDIYWDDKLPGFGVKVTPKGAKIYVLQYRMGGRGHKTQRYTIDNKGVLKPQQARERAEHLLGRVREGADIAGEARERKRIAVDLAFAPFVQDFADTTLKAHWPKSWKHTKRCLELHAVNDKKKDGKVMPGLGNKPLPDVTASDVRSLLKRLDHQPATKRNLFASLNYLFNKAVEDGALAVSPMAGMKPPPQVEERSRTLNEDELRWLVAAAAEENDAYNGIIRNLMLAGQRRSEVSGLPWAELSRGQAEWHLPKERAKNGCENIIPLTPSMIADFDKLAGGDKWPRKGLVFPSSKGTALSGFSKMKRRLDARMAKAADEAGATIERWTLHDLRRTLATNLQRLGVAYEVIEHLLNHKERVRVGIGKVYQTHGFKAEKLAALERWEAELARIISGREGVVIPFPRSA